MCPVKKVATLLIVVLSVLSVMSPLSSAQTTSIEELRNAIDLAVAEADMPNSWWTILVRDAETGWPLYEKDTGRSFIPASNTKLYTVASALDVLGPDFRYETTLWTDGVIVDGLLMGNLIVRGSGDPVIGGRFNDGDITETFRAWADSLKVRGIHRIEGNIVGDDDVFDDVRLGYGWQFDDLSYWYAAEISALSFNDNCVDFQLVAQQLNMPAELTWFPSMTSYISTENASLTVEAGGSIQEGYFREQGSNNFQFSSRVPQGSTDYESLTVSNPTAYFVHVLRETLLSEGISVGGSPVDVDAITLKPDYQSLDRLFTYYSPPLTDIVRVLLKRSQNLYAEQLLRTVGIESPVHDSDLEPGSAEMALARARQVYGAAGVDTLRLQLVDGSGLARQNLVTSTMTANLLSFMYHHSDSATRDAFIQALPVAGVDGTLASRMKGTLAEGNVRAKTGTLGNASALSGFVTTSAGTELIFSIMANHYTESSARPRALQDRILIILASHTR